MNGIPTIDWKKYLTEEEQRDIRRGRVADFLFGGDRASERVSRYMPVGYGRAGSEAISKVEEGLESPEREMAIKDLSGISRKLVEEEDDPEAIARFQRSTPLREHVQDLRAKSPSYPELKREHITKKGLGVLPAVKEYTEGKEAEFAAQKEAERVAGMTEQAGKMAGMIEEDQPFMAEAVRMLGSAGNIEEFAKMVKEINDNLESKRAHGRQTELQELKGEQAAELDTQRQEGRMELERYKAYERKQLKQVKQDAKDVKKEQDKKDINLGLETVITLAEGVEPSGRIMGFIKQAGKWAGFDPNLRTLDNTAGLLAGQVAKKIGGESGRLTDQDRVYALRVMPKSIDTPEERKMKIQVLRSFQDINATGESIRTSLIQAMGSLNKIAPGKYDPIEVGETTHYLRKGQEDEDFDKLPSGAMFIGPDGKLRRKP